MRSCAGDRAGGQARYVGVTGCGPPGAPSTHCQLSAAPVAAFLCQCARQPLGGPAQLYQARAEEAFLAGLLHNIGELFLLKVLERRGNHREQPLGLTQVLVDEVLEAMHADIGYRLMQRWGNPEQYARVARDHHAVELNEGDVLLVITRLLDVACEKLGIDRTPTSCWPHP
jgi:hypothetical protein